MSGGARSIPPYKLKLKEKIYKFYQNKKKITKHFWDKIFLQVNFNKFHTYTTFYVSF